MTQAQPHGDSVVVTWARRWAGLATGALVALAATAAAMAFAAGAGVPGVALALLGAVLAVAALRSARMLLSPPVMFTIDGHGVTTWLDGDRYGGSGFRVSWGAVTSIERRVGHEQPGNLRVDAIEIGVAPGVDVPARASFRGVARPQVLRLDASTGTIRGEALLEALRRARAAATGAGPAPGPGAGGVG